MALANGAADNTTLDTLKILLVCRCLLSGDAHYCNFPLAHGPQPIQF